MPTLPRLVALLAASAAGSGVGPEAHASVGTVEEHDPTAVSIGERGGTADVSREAFGGRRTPSKRLMRSDVFATPGQAPSNLASASGGGVAGAGSGYERHLFRPGTTPRSLVELAADEVLLSNAPEDRQPPLAGSGVFGRMVQTLTGWLRDSATFEEVYAMDQFRLRLSQAASPAHATTLLEDTMVPEDWNSCADEGYRCLCSTGILRFGHEEQKMWVYKNVSLKSGDHQSISISCGNDFFGSDPMPGQKKSCYCMSLWKVVLCRDGKPVDWARCPKGSKSATHLMAADGTLHVPDLYGEHMCSEGCDRSADLVAEPTVLLDKAGDHSESMLDKGSEKRRICSGLEPHDLLWSCKMLSSGTSSHIENSPLADAIRVMDNATRVMCADPDMARQLEVFLDCDFADNYRHWANKSSVGDWLEEAYITYIGGLKGSDYEWQATNLVRSVELFSTRPVIVVSFTNHYAPPVAWRNNRNVLVYRMHPGTRGVSFNFNKIRSMIAGRVLTGIQLDTDQIIAYGMDNVFASTRREVTEQYPFPILPVHWMSRDAKEGEPYHNYMLTGYDGPHTMRWGQAHPTWTYWALPFLTELLHHRLTTTGNEVKTWMGEDEDMLNVKLWLAGGTKQWCKFDLFPDLFVKGHNLEKNVYYDRQWYPRGIGLIFYASHATKEFSSTDWLVALLARCADPEVNATVVCKNDRIIDDCWGNWIGEKRQRLTTPAKHTSELCCCLRPRGTLPFYFSGNWYKDRDEVPDMTTNGGNSKCLFP